MRLILLTMDIPRSVCVCRRQNVKFTGHEKPWRMDVEVGEGSRRAGGRGTLSLAEGMSCYTTSWMGHLKQAT
jgi:hypothetical protein